MMDLETVRQTCEVLIERQQGNIKYWSARQMLEIATDLLRCIENTRTDQHLATQTARVTEEYRAVLEENRQLLKVIDHINEQRLWTTFKHEDGSLAMGEYTWMTEIDAFEEEALDRGEQIRVLAETWRLASKLIIVVGPEPEEDDDEEADPPDQLPV